MGFMSYSIAREFFDKAAKLYEARTKAEQAKADAIAEIAEQMRLNRTLR